MAIIAIAAYSGFVFMFYRLLARRDILNLDLSKYDQSMGGRIRAFFKTGAWLIQYALAIPILIAFWTVVMAVILTLLADGNDHAETPSSQHLWLAQCVFFLIGLRICLEMLPRCYPSQF